MEMHTQNHIVQNTWYRYPGNGLELGSEPVPWAHSLTQQTSITVYRLPTKENKRKFAVSVCSKQTGIAQFSVYICSICKYVYRYVCVCIYIYIDIDRHIYIYVDIHIS
jgi:hypothetical protein